MKQGVVRGVDLLASAAALAAGGFLVWRGSLTDGSDLVPSGRQGGVVALLVAAIIVAGLWRTGRWRPSSAAMARVVLLPLVAILCVVALARRDELHALERGEAIAVWPPRPDDSHAEDLGSLSSALRVRWALRVAMHRLTTTDAPSRPIDLPASWPFPDDVAVATRTDSAGVLHLWARADDGTSACLRLPNRLEPATDADRGREACESRPTPPASLIFAAPRRIPDAPSRELPAVTGPSWPQYRFDAEKHGIAAAGSTASAGWRTRLDDQARATVSVSGDLVFAGSHGLGHVVALDRATGAVRWQARVPNWVHQDPITDGRVVLIGFGSDWGSFAGAEPSGLAAFDRATGRHRWTAFDESSVMTTGTITDSVVVYVTAAGVLRKRLIRDGSLLAEARLPGGAIMAPPALHGDTLVVTLDRGTVCAALVGTLESLWCREFPGFRLMGHAAPTIADGLALVSGAALLRGETLDDLLHTSWRRVVHLFRTAIGPSQEYAGQAVFGLDLATGRTVWETRRFTTTREFKGHISGTATVAGGQAFIALPLADSLVALDVTTGTIAWTAEGGASRGPPLVVGDAVVLAGREGGIRVRDLATGALRCTIPRDGGYDRGGPAVGGDLMLLASLDGVVEAIPTRDLLGCAAGR